jgi:hypothetical protein
MEKLNIILTNMYIYINNMIDECIKCLYNNYNDNYRKCSECQYLFTSNRLKKILYDYELISIKYNEVEENKYPHREDIDKMIIKNILNDSEYYTEDIDDDILPLPPLFIRYKGNRINYDWLFNYLYLEKHYNLFAKAKKIFLENDYIPYKILEELSDENIQLLAYERYQKYREKEIIKYKNLLQTYLINNITDIIIEYFYPKKFGWKNF